MDDLISRQAAIDAVDKYFKMIELNGDICIDGLISLPSVQTEQRWIPVTERLPEDDTLMLVNYIDSRPDAMDIWIGWHEMENVWYIDGEEHSRERGNEVIAWMPLPEPYREDIE